MKTRSWILCCVLTLALCCATPAYAMEDGSAEAIAADVLVARPACFVATVVGSAIFVLALPFAALTKNVKKTADALVVSPAQATFTRELGALRDLTE